MAKHPMTRARRRVLAYVSLNPGCSVKRIFAELGLDMRNTQRTVAEMAKIGWLVMIQDLEDKRFHYTWKLYTPQQWAYIQEHEANKGKRRCV